MFRYTVHTDGGARGNPGLAAVGIVIEGPDNVYVELAKSIGYATNNVAEYSAVIEALRWILINGVRCKVEIFLDSELVVQQLNNKYKVKNNTLKSLLFRVRELEAELGTPILYASIPREKNSRADFLVNRALDSGDVSLITTK